MSELIIDNPLRDFVEQMYAMPNIAEAAINLQDRYGVDVNILLSMSWLGVQAYRMSNEALTELDALVTEFRRKVILPAREARRALSVADKQNVLYEALKATELDAEFQQLAMCYQYFSKREFEWHQANQVVFNHQLYLQRFTLKSHDYQAWLALVKVTHQIN